jgi:preprotein translocase subunit SecA
MDNLRDHIGLRSYAQVDPLVEYNKEAYTYFEQMFRAVDSEICKGVFTYEASRPQASRTPRRHGPMPAMGRGGRAGRGSDAPAQPVHTVRRTQKKIGPNEPCPCGSGLKYKKCCGKGG